MDNETRFRLLAGLVLLFDLLSLVWLLLIGTTAAGWWTVRRSVLKAFWGMTVFGFCLACSYFGCQFLVLAGRRNFELGLMNYMAFVCALPVFLVGMGGMLLGRVGGLAAGKGMSASHRARKEANADVA